MQVAVLVGYLAAAVALNVYVQRKPLDDRTWSTRSRVVVGVLTLAGGAVSAWIAWGHPDFDPGPWPW